MKACVLDGANRVSLAVVRGLAEAGWRLTCAENQRFARGKPITFYSKYVSSTGLISDADDDIYRLASDHNVLFPVSINTIIRCAKMGFKNAACGELSAIRKVNDKKNMVQMAKRLGIGTPETIDINSQTFPMVLKIKDDEGLYLSPEKRYRIVRDKHQLELAVKELSATGKELLAQEFIEGEAYGCSLIIHEKKVYALFCHRRIREYPSSGGPSTLCESIYDKKLVESSIALLIEADYNGVAMVEFKKDKKDNTYKLMEVNPRFWGTLPLAIRAGVNFPDIFGRLVMKLPAKPCMSYKTNVRLRFLLHDLAAALSSPCILPAFFMDLFDTRISDGVFSLRDPLPFAGQLGKSRGA